MKKLFAPLFCLFLVLVSAPAIPAAEHATPQEIFEKVLAAENVIRNLGEEGLKAFDDPKGEFVWKDTYVFATNCEKGIIAAHPSPKVRGLTSEVVKCKKTGRLILKEACQNLTSNGLWMEYWWPNLNSDEPVRKVVFVINVEGTPYQVAAAIVDEKADLEELNKLIVK